MLTPEKAERLIAEASFVWHQRWELVPGVPTPGANDIGWLLERSGLGGSFAGASVLDIGTTNGGLAFTAERAGATRVVAVDLVPPSHFGFDVLAEAQGSSVEFVQASAYELPERLGGEKFDVVVFWGVLYHMRHPLLALDAVHRLTKKVASIETAVADSELPPGSTSDVRFYRRDELGGDASNWFAPSVACLADWCASAGLEPYAVSAWPEGAPSRGLVNARPVPVPEYVRLSYEVPIRAVRLP